MSAGEEETDLDLGELIKKGEVAWLSAEEMIRASEAAQTGARRSPPASRLVFHQSALHTLSQAEHCIRATCGCTTNHVMPTG